MKIIPKKGDYLINDGMSDSDYEAVVSLLKNYGCGRGEARSYNQRYFGWSAHTLGICHATVAGESCTNLNGRELTIADLLGSEEEECFPAVGEKCNFETRDYMGECIISYIGIDHVLFIGCATNKEYAAGKDKVKFSPIKSEREKCVEEIIEIITRGKTVNNGYRSIAECIYDSGWRKV